MTALEFLDTGILHLSKEPCVSFLDPLIEDRDIDLLTFDMDVVLNLKLVQVPVRRFGFVERERVVEEERGLQELVRGGALSPDFSKSAIGDDLSSWS